MRHYREQQGFLARQLTDTQYLAKIARRYLTTVVTDVRVFPGRLTALLRHHWGLDSILSDDGQTKNRSDHRHHAIDALVVALADQVTLRRIQAANEIEQLRNLVVPPPWESLRSEVAQQTSPIVVSHRPDHNPAGKLHEETAYGPVRTERRRPDQEWEFRQGFNLVVRKPIVGIKADDLETIRDTTLRARMQEHLTGTSPDDKDAWAAALREFGAKTGVRTIRLLKKNSSARRVGNANGGSEKLIIPGDVYSVTFWRLPDGKIEAVPVAVFDANNPRYHPPRPEHPAARRLFTVHKGDLLRTFHKGAAKTVRVTRIQPSPTNQNLVCVLHSEATDQNKFTIQFGRVLATQTRLRGVPTEEILTELRREDSGVRYLVGTPKGRLTRFEAELAGLPWREVYPKLQVKLLPRDGEVYVLAQSAARVDKERGMRRRALKKYWKRLEALTRLKNKPPRDELLLKLGQAAAQAGQAAALVRIAVSAEGVLTYQLDRAKLRQVRQREGRYLLRTNLDANDPALIWRCYMQLVLVEEAFRALKGDLALRPVYHKLPERIEAHLFIAFLAYCLSITLRQHLRALAGGLMPRTVFEKFATLQMLDVSVPTTDGRELLLVRHTEPSREVALLLHELKLELPPQPPPKIRAPKPGAL